MIPEQASELTARVCALAPVIPVLVVDDVATAADLARALVAGGLPALEVTLRTPAALEVIREMAGVEGGVVGAGTLLTETDVEDEADLLMVAQELLAAGPRAGAETTTSW